MRNFMSAFSRSLLAAAAGISLLSVPVLAEDTVVSIDNITEWNLADDTVLSAYQLYLTCDEETRAVIDSQFTDPTLRQYAMDYVLTIQPDLITEKTRELVDQIRLLDPEFPELPKPAVPETPETPENPEDGKETTDPDDGSKPEKPADPEDGSDKKDPSSSDKPGNKPGEEKPEEPGKPEDPAKDENKDPELPAEGEELKPEDVTVSDKTDEDQIKDIEEQNPEGELDGMRPASDPEAPVVNFTYAAFSYRDKNRMVKATDIGWYNTAPDFSNSTAWQQSASSYNTPGLWGQCTWFAWGRFYEIYGFNPGFRGNGNTCAYELLAAHPDKFERSSTPKAGAIFSSDMQHNHVGIVLDVNPVNGNMLIQEGNLDGVSNPNWDVATKDYRTIELSLDDLKAMYGNVVFANPKDGAVKSVGQPEQPILNEDSIDSIREIIEKEETVKDED